MAHDESPAGCGFATTWVQVYLIEAVDGYHSCILSNPLSFLYLIDEFGLTGSGDTDVETARTHCSGAAALKHMLEDELSLQISVSKTQVIASTDKLQG